MKGGYRPRTEHIKIPVRSTRDRVTGPRFCSSCGNQLLFVGSGKRKVFEDERYGSTGLNKCWKCFKRVLHP